MLSKTNLILFVSITLSTNIIFAMQSSEVVISYATILKLNKFHSGDAHSILRNQPIKEVKISTNAHDTAYLSFSLNTENAYNDITLFRKQATIEIWAIVTNKNMPDTKKKLLTTLNLHQEKS
jgi:hypothetical protein